MINKLKPSLSILITTTLNGVMCWAINQMPDKDELGITPKIIILLTVCSTLAIAGVSSWSSGSKTSLEKTSFTWTEVCIFGLIPAIGSIILFCLIKYGYVPIKWSQLTVYFSLILFAIGTLSPVILAVVAVISSKVHPIPVAPPSEPKKLDLPTLNLVKHRLAIILNTESFKRVGQSQLEAIVTDLRHRSGDNLLTIIGLEKGSIILTLEGSEKGINKIEYLYNSGKMSEILGISIKQIYRLDERKPTLQEQAGISVNLYLQSQNQVEKILQQKLNIAPEEKLFGVQENLDKLKQYLQDKEGSWFISITGEGGIGKTSIAEKLIREYAAISGFENLAWITAKKVYLTLSGKTKDLKKTLNVDSMICEIAKQLGINLPAAVDEQFFYLQEQLQLRQYLIVIDNLETLVEYQTFFEKFDSNGSKNNFSPSKIIFTSRVTINNQINNTNLELKGLNEKASLELIKYQGKDVDRIRNATDSQLLQLYSQSNGNPLLIKQLVNLIKTHDLPLNKIFAYLEKQDDLLDYLYALALESISNEAKNVICAMTNYAPSSIVSYNNLKTTTKKEDSELREAIQELVNHNLLSRIPSQINQEPSYSIHNLLYEYLEPND